MRRTSRILNTAFAATLALGATALSASGQEADLNAGVYTKAQAEAGQELFTQNCSGCHNVDFYKSTLNGYNNQPLQYLFESIVATMPADRPGALMDSEYEDIMAHILSLLEFPAGEERLSYASGEMMNTKVIRAN